MLESYLTTIHSYFDGFSPPTPEYDERGFANDQVAPYCEGGVDAFSPKSLGRSPVNQYA